jgi:hypothetical protein
MISFGYRLTDPATLQGWEHGHDVGTAAKSDLLWSAFPGDVSVSVGAVEISTQFGWVPLLHFAASIIGITEKLSAAGSRAVYSFTEADEQLRFDRGRELIQISASFTPEVLSTSLPELSLAAREFVARLVDELSLHYPRLSRNPAVTDLLERSAGEGFPGQEG